MSIALFPTPLRAELRGLPVLILGLEQGTFNNNDDSWCNALVVDDVGKLNFVGVGELDISWRYDWRDHAWIEVDELGQEEPPDDGSAQLSGSIPDPDRVSVGDSIDQEGRPTPGSPGGLDPSGETGDPD